MNQFPCFDILPEQQLALWSYLAVFRKLDLVLYGGTAVALQLGHRQSVDFDFFTDKEISKEQLYEVAPFLNESQIIQDEPRSWSFITSRGVKLSFFSGLKIGRIGCPRLSPDGVAVVASLEDLLSLKIAVITQRAEAKDYVDIAAMLKFGLTLSAGLAGAVAIYGNRFSVVAAVKALGYFDDLDKYLFTPQYQQMLVTAIRKLALDLPVIVKASQKLS